MHILRRSLARKIASTPKGVVEGVLVLDIFVDYFVKIESALD